MNPELPVSRIHTAVQSELKPEYGVTSGRYIDQRWATLCWSRLALSLGARISVVEKVTGIDHSELTRIFTKPKGHRKSCGNSPKTIGWFIRANLIVSVQAAHFYTIFSQLREAGILPAEALIKAYEKYFHNFEHDVRLSFDRAFQLVSQVDGFWNKAKPLLQKSVCVSCGALYLVERRGTSLMKDCPICELNSRYARSLRLSRTIPSPSLVAMLRLRA
jgi:hypothetical protein